MLAEHGREDGAGELALGDAPSGRFLGEPRPGLAVQPPHDHRRRRPRGPPDPMVAVGRATPDAGHAGSGAATGAGLEQGDELVDAAGG